MAMFLKLYSYYFENKSNAELIEGFKNFPMLEQKFKVLKETIQSLRQERTENARANQNLTQENHTLTQENQNLTQERIRNAKKLNQTLTVGILSILASPLLYTLFFEVIPFVGLQGTNINIQNMCSNGKNSNQALPKFYSNIHTAPYTNCTSNTSTLLPKEITDGNFIIEDKGFGYANLIVLNEEGKPKKQVALNFSNATGKEILTFMENNKIPSNTVSITTPRFPVIFHPQTPIADAAKILSR